MKRVLDRRTRIFLGDLSYANAYAGTWSSAPLNIGYVASYLLSKHREECEVTLFKDPERLLAAAKEQPPHVLGLSCSFWNLYLDVLVAKHVKAMNPECLTVVGGPNVDTDPDEEVALHREFDGALDFMTVNDGEPGFANIIGALLSKGRDRLFDEILDGCTFVDSSGRPQTGEDVGLTLDLETVPSPILNGLLDPFLNANYIPMLQTSRMCPYSCTYCASGKLRSRMRLFPEQLVKDEIAYLAEKYRDYPHCTLFITDDNFGVNERDSRIAQFLAQTRESVGYPKQTFCYLDKKFTPSLKKCVLFFGDMNAGGLPMPFQSLNEDTLFAVRRQNISSEDVPERLAWAREHGLRASSEVIFGLPCETKQSFLDGLEYLMRSKMEMIAAHNLFLLKGIELNRQQERERFGLVTRFRPSFASAYGMIGGDFVCESEEVVVSSSHFSFEDFMDVRKISLMFYVINGTQYFKHVVNFLIDNQVEVVPLFDKIMNPPREVLDIPGYADYVNDFTAAALSELHHSHDEVHDRLLARFRRDGNSIKQPARLNVWFATRLIYKEDWFGRVLSRLLEREGVDDRLRGTVEELTVFSENEWIDLRNPEDSKQIVLHQDALDSLGIKAPASRADAYCVTLAPTEHQTQLLAKYRNQYLAEDDSYFYNALDVIVPRSNLRFDRITAEALSR